MLILVQQENEQGRFHIFQDTYSEIFHIHQLTILYCYEHVNHEIFLNFYFKIYTNSSGMRVSPSVISSMFR